jgi:hypothetical protein
MRRRLTQLLILTVAFFGAMMFSPAPAQAVNLSGAQSAANWESANICPHHSSGKCLHRRATVIQGIGGGWWVASAEGWECYWWEPCGVTDDWRHSRWYYEEGFKITASGGITQRYWY